MGALGTGLGGALTPLGASSTLSPSTAWEGVLEENLGVDPVAASAWITPADAYDELRVTYGLDVVRAAVAALSDTVGLAPTQVGTIVATIGELLALADSPSAAGILQAVPTEGVALSPALIAGIPATLAETVGLADTLAVLPVAVLLERLAAADTLAGAAVWYISLSEVVRMSPDLQRFLGADVTEALALSAATLDENLRGAIVAEGLGLADTMTPQFLIRADVDESLELSLGEALQMLYSPVISETLELQVGYLAPNGSFVTWVMNTRSGAVTEYQNYAFNSFARVGNRYFGASDTGLYELHGDDDDGADVVATLKGGFLQFGGTKLARLKAAYLAVLGSEDEFVLRIETRDGATYNYRASTRDGRSTKYHMGKGQRSRYFAWELTSVGQDFDLDTLEFVPLVLQRRV